MVGELHLLFIRHGETQDNIDKILQGHRDTSLTERGHGEAVVLAEKLQNQHIDAIYHSPLIRITQTIDPIIKGRSNTEIHTESDLKGQCLGELEGESYDTINMSSPRSADGQPGVELFDEFVQRLKNVFGRIVGAEASRVGDRDRVVLVATHGVGITSLFKALESTPQCDNFNAQLAERGPEAYEVRWTDSDDIAKINVKKPAELPITNSQLVWDLLQGWPFLIERWGKKEKAI